MSLGESQMHTTFIDTDCSFLFRVAIVWLYLFYKLRQKIITGSLVEEKVSIAHDPRVTPSDSVSITDKNEAISNRTSFQRLTTAIVYAIQVEQEVEMIELAAVKINLR